MASLTPLSYAEIALATVEEALPTWKNQRATSCPAPISAKVPKRFASRLIWRAFSSAVSGVAPIGLSYRGLPDGFGVPLRCGGQAESHRTHTLTGVVACFCPYGQVG